MLPPDSKLGLVMGEAELFAGLDEHGNQQEIDMDNPEQVEKLQAELELSLWDNFNVSAYTEDAKLEFIKAIFRMNQI